MSDNSTMDFDALLNAPVDVPLSTSMALCPEGIYTARIDDLPPEGLNRWMREIDTKNGRRQILSVPYVILDDSVKSSLGRDKVTVRQDLWLDVEGGRLATGEGKNIDLGRLREALGQNSTPGWTFGSLPGAGPVSVKVEHRSDPKNTQRKFDGVTRVAPIGTL